MKLKYTTNSVVKLIQKYFTNIQCFLLTLTNIILISELEAIYVMKQFEVFINNTDHFYDTKIRNLSQQDININNINVRSILFKDDTFQKQVFEHIIRKFICVCVLLNMNLLRRNNSFEKLVVHTIKHKLLYEYL